jgi:hypothetical protein
MNKITDNRLRENKKNTNNKYMAFYCITTETDYDNRYDTYIIAFKTACFKIDD